MRSTDRTSDAAAEQARRRSARREAVALALARRRRSRWPTGADARRPRRCSRTRVCASGPAGAVVEDLALRIAERGVDRGQRAARPCAVAAGGRSRRAGQQRSRRRGRAATAPRTARARVACEDGDDDARALSADKAQRIVDAMRASVGERGAAGSTFDHVAREAGVSRGLLHYYFGTEGAAARRGLPARLRHPHGGARRGVRRAGRRRRADRRARAVARGPGARGPGLRRADLRAVHAPPATTRRRPAGCASSTGGCATTSPSSSRPRQPRGTSSWARTPTRSPTVLFALADGLAFRMLSEPDHDWGPTRRGRRRRGPAPDPGAVRRLGYVAGALRLALVVAQLIGPALAEQRVRGMLDDHGEVVVGRRLRVPGDQAAAAAGRRREVRFSSLELGTGDIGEQLEDVARVRRRRRGRRRRPARPAAAARPRVRTSTATRPRRARRR